MARAARKLNAAGQHQRRRRICVESVRNRPARPRTREEIMDKLVLGWLLGVPVLMLIVLQYLM
jgi:Fe2+ transport system protein B